MPSDDRDDIIQDWRNLMNMDAKELEDFLQTPESNDCGQKDDDGEAKGHKSGRYIVELLGRDDDEYTEEDVAHMKKVRSYCSRHLKQGNSKDPEHSKWRYSLMNWGHDPLKD